MKLSSHVSNLFENNSSLIVTTKKRDIEAIQYLDSGNIKRPCGVMRLPDTEQFLEAGVYKILSDMQGVYYSVHDINTDALLRFKDARSEEVLEEIKDFWSENRKEKFKSMGFTHKRGIILYGDPGVGKSCLLKLVMEQMVAQGDVVFIADSQNSYTLLGGLKKFKEIEPNRNCVVILEDIDESMQYNEKLFLNLLDGDDQLEGVLYLATTNHINRISDRFKRPGRFDRKLKIHTPPKEGRLAYFTAKLGIHESDNVLDELSEETDGLSFGQLREFLVAVYCLDQDREVVLNRLRGVGGLEETYSESEADIMLDAVLNCSRNSKSNGLALSILQILDEVN